MKQQELFSYNKNRSYGGSLVKGCRKSVRPLDRRKPLHLILKTTSTYLLLNNKNQVLRTISRMNQRFSIKEYSVAVQADHVHLQIGFHSRLIYVRWIRALTGALALRFKIKFKFLPFTRITAWGRDFKNVNAYIFANGLEGEFILECHLWVEEQGRWDQVIDWDIFPTQLEDG